MVADCSNTVIIYAFLVAKESLAPLNTSTDALNFFAFHSYILFKQANTSYLCFLLIKRPKYDFLLRKKTE